MHGATCSLNVAQLYPSFHGHEATRLSAEEAAAEAAASVNAAAVEASKKSAEALHKAQREADEAEERQGLQQLGPLHHHARRQPGVGSGWVVSRLPSGGGKGHCRTASSAPRWPHRSDAGRERS